LAVIWSYILILFHLGVPTQRVCQFVCFLTSTPNVFHYKWCVGFLTFRHRASCILGQVFRYSPENAFYIFNQQMYFII